jgi:hypothetical protein
MSRRSGVVLEDGRSRLGEDGFVLEDRASPEIITGLIEADAEESKVFAIVRDQHGRAKQRVQAITRQRGPATKVRVVSDGVRSIAGKWFNANEQHILDWYHIARRFEAIGKGLIYCVPSRGRIARSWIAIL